MGTPPLNWTLDVTIELTITKTEKVYVLNQQEAMQKCDELTARARQAFPHAYIGCGVTNVTMAKDKP